MVLWPGGVYPGTESDPVAQHAVSLSLSLSLYLSPCLSFNAIQRRRQRVVFGTRNIFLKKRARLVGCRALCLAARDRRATCASPRAQQIPTKVI